METVGIVETKKYNWNTCQLDGRVFSTVERGKKMVISETLVGEDVGETEVATGVELDDFTNASLCAFNGMLLALVVTEENRTARSATLVKPGQPLAEGATEVVPLEIRGRCSGTNIYDQIVQVSPTEVLLSAWGSSDLFLLTVSESERTVKVAPLALKLPGKITWDCTLVRLGNGKVFAIGGDLGVSKHTNRVTLVNVARRTCTEMAPLPVPGRGKAGGVGVGRFILVFGGESRCMCYNSDLVVYDTGSQRSCVIPRTGDWHEADEACVLAVSEEYLYVLGGFVNFPCTKISLAAIHAGIPGAKLMLAFHLAAFGVPCAFSRVMLQARLASRGILRAAVY